MRSSDSLAALFRATHRDLVRRAAKLLGCRVLAEDVAQEAFAGLLSRSASMVIAEPRAYLFAAARNLAVDQRRRERTRASAGPEALDELVDPAPIGDAVAASRERLALLGAALNELPEATRTAFLLARLEGLPHREIATRMAISVSMVEKHVARALEHTLSRLLPNA